MKKINYSEICKQKLEYLNYSPKTKIIQMKTRLIRKEYDGNNSLFFIKAEYITNVWDTEGNRLKFDYNIPNEKLTIFGDYEGIYVLYQ